MYKANTRHQQPLLISNVNQLPDKKHTQLVNSWAHDFYRDFFCRIREDSFAVLYAECPSRPNVPVNWLVGLETLKSGFGWSDEELYDHFSFDLQVRYALGIHDLSESDFDLRSLYYFRQRLSQYNLAHGVNLLAQGFEDITDQQIAALQLKTERQRMDSTQIASNILDASRLQLLVEAVQRLDRNLSEADQAHWAELLAPYRQGHSGQYVYRVKGKEATQRHLQQIGEVIHTLLTHLADAYAQTPAYQVLLRFFTDNYRLAEDQVCLKADQELAAGCLQSVDDLEATFRRKANREYKGYVANLSETCHPDNPLQLITQTQIAPNNVEDADLLADGLSRLKVRTGVETLYTDGGFASPRVDAALQSQQVEQIQTGIRGPKLDPQRLSLADFAIQWDAKGQPCQVSCPQGQSVAAHLSNHRRGYFADFEPQVCQTCPFHVAGQCRAAPGKKRTAYRLTFLPEQAVVAGRRRKLRTHQQSGKNYRAAVEGTVREVKHLFPGGKLPVRGLFRVACLIVSSAAMTNIRRIHHYFAAQRQAQRWMESQDGGPKASASPRMGVFWTIFRWLGTLCRSQVPLTELCFGC